MKKGITATSVAIMVVIILILVGTVSITSYNTVQNANKLLFALEISEIQEEVTRYYKDSNDNTYPVSGNVYTVNLAQVTDEAITQFNAEIKNANNEITLYELDLTAIGITDTNYGNKKSEKDVYVVSKETGKVYYLDGIKAGQKTYYTMTNDLIDIKERNEKPSEEENQIAAPIITTDGIVSKTLSTGEKEIYVPNIKISGEQIEFVKYEIGIISEENASLYFSKNGNTLSSDRIKLKELTAVTIYAQNMEGDYDIEYVQ